MSLSVGNGSSGSIGQRSREGGCCPSLTDQQKKVICTITGMLATLGFGAMVVLAVPSIGIVPWRVSLGVSFGLVAIIAGSIYFYPRSVHSAAPTILAQDSAAAPAILAPAILAQDSAAAPAISAQRDVQQAGIVRPTLERYEQTRVAPPSGALARVAKVELQMIFSHFSLTELASMRLVSRCIYHITTQCVLDYIQKNKMLSAPQLEMVSKFFQKPELGNWFGLEPTRIVLARIPMEICARMTYLDYNGSYLGLDVYTTDMRSNLDCNSTDEDLVVAQLPALRTIHLSPRRGRITLSRFAFSRFQQACQGKPIEIVLFNESTDLEQLEKVRQIVCPHSKKDDFRGIPVGYMKNVKEITISQGVWEYKWVAGEWVAWSAEDTNLELEKLRTLQEETLNQITSLRFDLPSISPSARSGFLAILPNLTNLREVS